MYKVAGFDVGYKTMAVAVADVNKETLDINVNYGNMSNLGSIKCIDRKCIYDSNDKFAGHKVLHYVNSIHEHIKDCDLFLIEIQNPMGLTGIEQALYIYLNQNYSTTTSSQKVKMVSPNSMHSFFNMSKLKRIRRHEIVVLMEPYLKNIESFVSTNDKSHLADACGFIVFYTQKYLIHEFTKERMGIQEGTNIFSKYAFTQ